MLEATTLTKNEKSKEETTCLQLIHNSNIFYESHLKRHFLPRESDFCCSANMFHKKLELPL